MRFIIVFSFLFSFGLHSESAFLKKYKADWKKKGCPSSVSLASQSTMEVDTLCNRYMRGEDLGLYTKLGYLKKYKADWKKKGCPSSVSKAAKGTREVDTICYRYVAKNNPEVTVDMSACPCEKKKRDQDLKAQKIGSYLCRDEIIARNYYVGKGKLAKDLCPINFADVSSNGPTCFLDAEIACVNALTATNMVSSGVCSGEYAAAESEISYEARKSLREDSKIQDFNAQVEKILLKYKNICKKSFVDGQRTDTPPITEESSPIYKRDSDQKK